jgi:Rod binding domain-containing protein
MPLIRNSVQLYDIGLVSFKNQTPKSLGFATENIKLRDQTDAFESIMVKMLLDNAMVESKSIFSKKDDPAEKIYNSMYHEELAKVGTGGFGFSQMLYEYLSKKD